MRVKKRTAKLKKNNDVLELKRNSFKKIFNKMQVGVYIVNQHNDIEYVNPVIEKEFGPVKGRKCYEYFHERTEVCPWCKNQEVFSGKSVKWEWYSFKSGKTYDLLDTPIVNEDGSISKLEIFHDITERKKAEDALRESEERYRMLVETMNEGLKVQDEHGLLTYVNKRFCEMLGYSRDEIIRHSVTDFLEKSSQNIHKEQIVKLRRGRSEPYEIIWVRKDGQRILTYVSPNPIFDREGRYKGSFSVITDITERKKAEEERFRLAAAVESTAEAIVITDSKGMIQYVNPTFERLTGYAKGEVIRHDLHILDSGKHDEAFYKALRDTLRRGEVWSGTLISKKKDGALYPEECTISPVKGPSGVVVNYVAVKHDMTEKIRLESIAEAVDAMNNMGYIFSGIRHEIGNPVNTMKITLSVLKNNINNYSKETVTEYIDRVLTQISRVEYLLRTMKNFNMYETLQLMNVNMTSFMDNFLSLVANDFERKGIKIEAIVYPEAKWGCADPRALQQVMLNILINASDALEGRENPKIIIAISKMAGMIVVRITDNGCGISEEQQKRLFKPFYTNKAHGTGLGLVIAKKMLIKMNGTIEITSRKNEGTVAELFIPEGKDEQS